MTFPQVFRRSVLPVCLLLASGARALAQSPDAPSRPLTALSLEELGAIEVTSVSKQPEQVWQTPVAITVISSDDIRRSGATSIPEVLRLAPGVQVSRIDADHWAVGIRGFADQFSKSMLVLIDGRSIYTPLFAGMYWPAHDTLLEDIDRIEVIRGPGGTIWGANAVNGVINIITKAAADTQGTLVSGGAGNVDHALAGARYGGRHGALDWRVYAKGTARDGQQHPSGDAYDAWETAQSGFRGDWSGQSSQRFTLQGDVSIGTHGQRVALVSPATLQRRVDDGALRATGANILAAWHRQSTAGRDLQVTGYWERTAWDAPHFAETRDTLDVDLVDRLPLGRHTLTWGGGGRVSPGRFSQRSDALLFTPARVTDTLVNLFVEDAVAIVPARFSLIGGTRLLHNNYTGAEVQPAVRALWTPTPTTSVWAAISRAVRTPSRIERGVQASSLSATAQGVPILIQAVGDPGFDAERLVAYEAGFRTLLGPKVFVDVAAFRNRHEGLAAYGAPAIAVQLTPPVHVTARFPQVNGMNGISEGLEWSSEWRAADRWSLRGSYAFARVDAHRLPISIDPAQAATLEGMTPRHQWQLQSRATLPGAIDLDLTYRHISALPAHAVEGYQSADLRVGRTWRSLELFAVGQNLLDAAHAEFDPSVQIRRAVFVGATWRVRP
jgi:iron complex outermembrane receptor protein